MEFNFNLAGLSQETSLKEMDQGQVYDVLIIGGGPAALTAAVYCMRKGLLTGILTLNIGGQLIETAGIENYMGYRYIEGMELVDKFQEQVKQFEIGLKEGYKAIALQEDKHLKVDMSDDTTYKGKAVIIATGQTWRQLGIPGEQELKGRGVAYCVTCDAPLFSGKKVAVVGGGNSGAEAALDLASIAAHVTIVQNLDHLTADQLLIEKLKNKQNINFIYNSSVQKINGTENIESVEIVNMKTKQMTLLEVEGVFIEIGMLPNTDLVKGFLDLNKYGEITIDCACKTSRKGVFAAGDVTSVPYKQIIIAAGEGAKAALSAHDYILKSS